MEVETGNEIRKAPDVNNRKDRKPDEKRKGSVTGGLVLIAIGIIFLLEKYIPGIQFKNMWPIILIVIGVGLLFNAFRDKTNN